MSNFYVVCSNPECSFSALDKHFLINACPYCASDTIKSCEKCNTFLMFKGQEYCHHCKAPIRPKPSEEQPST